MRAIILTGKCERDAQNGDYIAIVKVKGRGQVVGRGATHTEAIAKALKILA